MSGSSEKASACVPSEATDTRSIAPVRVSVTKTSTSLLVSSGTRLDAGLAHATRLPSALSLGHQASSSPCAPSAASEMRLVGDGRGRAKSAFPFAFFSRTTTCWGSEVDTPAADATTW